jgi:single-strand DNA-binding protein
MNVVILKGNITRDPELKYTPNGIAVLDIGIAVNKTWTTEAGEKKEKVTFVDCRAWRGTAETVAKHFTKGKPILIQGELAQEEWEDKETGKKRRKTLILIDRFEFAGDLRARPAAEEPEDRRAKPRNDEGRMTNDEKPEPAPDGPMSRPLNEEDLDIPF